MSISEFKILAKNTLFSVCLIACASSVMAQELDCDGGESYGDYIGRIEGGGKGHHATNPGSTATGKYQFLIGTLKNLGYVSGWDGKASDYFGDASWSGVKWTGKDGITSREAFMNSPGAQDNAFAEFTQKNLDSVAGKWVPGEVVNGVKMTPGGVAAATHMLGTGGFTKWAKSGFSPSGLDAGIARAHGWSQASYNNHLMKRVATAGCMDPGDITSSGNDKIDDLPEVFLMPFSREKGPAPILPGTFTTAI